MAVKPETIKARLKALFPKANLSTKRLDAIAAKLAQLPADDADDAAVDAILNQANDFNSFEEIAREDDRIRTLEAKANQTQDPPTPPKASAPTPTTDEVPSWAQSILDTNKKLSEDLEALKSGRITETKKENAKSAFEKSEILKGLKPEIKESWFNRIDVDAETPIEDQVKVLETEFTDIRQSFADTQRFAGPTPFGSESNNKPSADEVAEIVDNLI